MKFFRNSLMFLLIIFAILFNYFDHVTALYDQGNPREWAIKWNGIGRSKNASDRYEKAWRGKELSNANKQRLIEKVTQKPAKEVYEELQSRPQSNISPYGTCMIGKLNEVTSFFVQGMYGVDGFIGYPKNPETGDGKGHIYSCNTEHKLVDLCSYKSPAERAKQTLLLAIENDVCTDYDKSTLNSIAPFDETLGLQNRVAAYLLAVGLTPRSRKTEESVWEEVCNIRIDWMSVPYRSKASPRFCTRTFDGEISRVRAVSKGDAYCSLEVTTMGSGLLSDNEEKVAKQYDDAIQSAIEIEDDEGADSLRAMKKEHLIDFILALNRDTVKVTAVFNTYPMERKSCEITVEAQIRRVL